VHQRGRDKGGADRGRAQFTEDRQTLAKLTAGKTKKASVATMTTISLGNFPPRQSRAIKPPASRNKGSGIIPTFILSITCHQRCFRVAFGVSMGSRVAENALSVVLIGLALSLLFIFEIRGLMQT
jgi:hypothetical protein